MHVRAVLQTPALLHTYAQPPSCLVRVADSSAVGAMIIMELLVVSVIVSAMVIIEEGLACGGRDRGYRKPLPSS